MSIANKLEYLKDTKAEIRTAIQQKGVSVAKNDSFRSYAGKIGEIGSASIDGYYKEKIYNFFYVLQQSFKKIPPSVYALISNINQTTNTTMANMFCYCSGLEEIDLSMLDTSNVVSMGSMFDNCSSLKEVDLSSFDTSNVTNMLNMFYYCSSLKTVHGILNMIKVNSLSYMLYNCINLETIYIKNLNCTGLDLSYCKKLSYNSLIYLISNLVDLSGQASKSLILGAENSAKLSNEEKAIATNKNWTLAVKEG